MLAWLKLDVMLGSMWKFAAASLFVATFGLTGCGDDPVKAGVAKGCTLNSDCNGGLVCSFGLCHQACEVSTDCPAGQRCVQTDGSNVCQLNEEAECHFKSDCEDPLVCAIDLQCRNQCQEDEDCLKGQKCAEGGVCAEPAEVNEDGTLIGAVDNVGGAGNEGGSGGSGGTGGSGGSAGSGGSGGSAIGGDTGDGGMPPVACVPGGDCVPADQPCKLGVVACTGGVETCEAAADADDGEDCGTDKVCDGGECVACKVDQACQPTQGNVCVTGKLSCANGPSCNAAGNAQNGTECGTDKVCAIGMCVDCKQGDACQPANTCKNGAWACATGPVCNPTTDKAAGTTCDTGKVCDSAAACVACVPDAACEPTNECHQGTQTCATGPNCVDTQLPAPDGSACTGNAAYNFCAAGVCAACQTGATCIPANPCHKGTLQCSTTPPTCNDSQANVADGLACGDNKSCIAGACVTNNRVLTITSGAVADVAVNAPFVNVSVKLVDANNTALQGVPITVVPAAGAYGVAGNTGANGVAQVSGRVGRAIGSYKFTVSAPGASSVEFTAKAVAPDAKDVFTLVNVNGLSGAATVPGPGTMSKLYSDARAVTSAADGTLYIAAQCGVYKLNPAGVLTHIAGMLTSGNDWCGSSGDIGAGTTVRLSTISGLALDEANGFLYIADDGNFKVRQLDLSNGNILTFAGSSSAPSTAPYGDGGPAESAYVRPSGVSVAPNGDVYISDWYTNRLRKVDFNTGIITSVFTQVACNQNNPLSFYDCGSWGDACTAAWDKDGKLFLAARFCGAGQSYFYGVVRVEADKSLSIVAGKQGNTHSPAEGGTATSAIWTATPTIAFDKAGNLFLPARADHRIHRVDAVTTRITTVAGIGVNSNAYAGDYGPGNAAALKFPSTVSFDAAGNLYFTDSGNYAVRSLWGIGSNVAPTATLAKLAGTTDQTVKLDAAFAPLSVKLTDSASANISGADITWKRIETGSGFFSTGASTVTTKTISTGVSSQTGRVGLAAGNYTFQASYTDIHGVPVTGSPQTFTVVAEAPTAGHIFPVVNYVHTSGSEGVPGPATFAKLTTYAHGVAVATDGTMYVSDNCSVFKVTPRGEISLFANGTGCGTASGDSGPAVGAKMSTIYALALDEPRNVLYIADNGNSRIRMVSLTTGVIETLAGGGAVNTEPYGDNGPATDANIGGPFSVSVDPNGLVYVPDYSHNRIRVVNPETGIITTWLTGNSVACAQGVVTFRTVQHLYTTVRFKANGDAYVSGGFCPGTATNFSNVVTYAIALRLKADGSMTRIAGLNSGVGTEGADAVASEIPTVTDFVIEANGDLVLALGGDNRVRRINMQTGKINTIAGNGTAGYALPTDVSAEPGAYVPGTSALLKTPWKVAAFPGGHVLIADRDNQSIRMIW